MPLQDGNPSNDFLRNFEVKIEDIPDAPPVFTSRSDARVKEDVVVTLRELLPYDWRRS